MNERLAVVRSGMELVDGVSMCGRTMLYTYSSRSATAAWQRALSLIWTYTLQRARLWRVTPMQNTGVEYSFPHVPPPCEGRGSLCTVLPRTGDVCTMWSHRALGHAARYMSTDPANTTREWAIAFSSSKTLLSPTDGCMWGICD